MTFFLWTNKTCGLEHKKNPHSVSHWTRSKYTKYPTHFATKNKMIKSYKHLQRQCHVKKEKKKKKRPTVVASVMVISCLVPESMHCWFVCLCRHSVTLHQGQGHQNEHEHIWHLHVYRHAKFQWILSEILHKKKSRLRRIGDLKWRSSSSLWQWSQRPLVGLSSQKTWWAVPE